MMIMMIMIISKKLAIKLKKQIQGLHTTKQIVIMIQQRIVKEKKSTKNKSKRALVILLMKIAIGHFQ